MKTFHNGKQAKNLYVNNKHVKSMYHGGVKFYDRTPTIVLSDTFTKLPNPASLPTGQCRGCTFSPDGNHFVTVGATSPLMIYKRSGSTFTKLPDPAVLPQATGWRCDYSPNGSLFAVGSSSGSAPFYKIYKVSGDTYTDIGAITNGPGAGAIGCAFSPSGDTLAYAAGGVTIHPVSGQTVGAGVSVPSMTYPSGLCYSPEGDLFVVIRQVTPYLHVFTISGTAVSAVSFDQTVATDAQACAFSPNGKFLAVANMSSPYIAIYERGAGTSFTRLPNPATLPGGTGYNCCWSHDSRFLVVAHNGSPFMTIYERSGSTFTKKPNPASLPAAIGIGCAFSPDDAYLGFGMFSSPFVSIYSRV